MSQSPLKGEKEKGSMRQIRTHSTVQALHFDRMCYTEVKKACVSYRVWAQAACPRTDNSFELPPPWFWLGLDRRRTAQWPSGSPVAYQRAVSSPFLKEDKCE